MVWILEVSASLNIDPVYAFGRRAEQKEKIGADVGVVGLVGYTKSTLASHATAAPIRKYCSVTAKVRVSSVHPDKKLTTGGSNWSVCICLC